MPRKLRSAKLNTIQNVAIEMSRIYRRTKNGEIPTPDGYRMVMILAAIKACLETGQIEEKIAALEAAIQQQQLANVTPFSRPKAVS